MGKIDRTLTCPECGSDAIKCKRGKRVIAGSYSIQRCCTCGYYLKGYGNK